MASHALKIAAGVVLTGLVSAVPASAQVDPFDEVLSVIGITGRERPHIDYRERAPLVVPPAGQLRPPEQRAAGRNGRWPNDPDVDKRRRAAAMREGVPQYGAGDDATSARPVRDGTRNRFAGVPTAGTYGEAGENNPARALSRDQVTAIHAAGAADASTPSSGVDPGRRTLTDPPRGYRAAQGGRPVKATLDPMRNTDSVEIDVNRPQY